METPDVYAKVERLEDALNRIEQWARAYPVEVFVPLTDEEVKRAGEILAENDISIAGLHGGWARHILSGIADIIAKAKQEE